MKRNDQEVEGKGRLMGVRIVSMETIPRNTEEGYYTIFDLHH